MKKSGWKLIPAAFLFLTGFAFSTNRFLFFSSLFYFLTLYSFYVLLSRLPFTRILPLLTYLFSIVLFLYGILQKIVLFPLLLSQVKNANTPFANLIETRLASGRIFGLFPLPTLYAMVIGVLLLLSIHFFLQTTPKNRLAWVLLIGMGLTNLYFSASFGTLFALSAAMILYLILTNKIGFRFLFPLGIITSLIFFLVTAMRFSEVRTLEPVRLRLANWFQAIRAILDRPLTGWGLGSYEIVVPNYINENEPASIFAHSFPLQLVAEIGIPVTILLIVITIAWIRQRRTTFLSPPAIPFTAALFLIAIFNLIDIGMFFIGCGILVSFCFSQITPHRNPLHPILTVSLIVSVIAFGWMQHSASKQRNADIYYSRSEIAPAEKLYLQSLNLFPWSYKTLSSLALIEFNRNNLEKADQYSQKALMYAPNQGMAHYLRSKIAYIRQMYTSSLFHAKMAVAGNRRNFQYREWYETLVRSFSAPLDQTRD